MSIHNDWHGRYRRWYSAVLCFVLYCIDYLTPSTHVGLWCKPAELTTGVTHANDVITHPFPEASGWRGGSRRDSCGGKWRWRGVGGGGGEGVGGGVAKLGVRRKWGGEGKERRKEREGERYGRRQDG